jgi:hypothetical protein
MTEARFHEPRALRRSVTDRLAALATSDGRVNLNDLLRQFAYDRLLCRIFSGPDADRWVLKGATALLVRFGPEARHTLDVDLYRRSGGADEAEDALRVAASRDVGDFFRFEVAPGRPIGVPGEARRFRIVAYLGVTEFASFGVDLVTDLNVTGAVEEMEPLLAGTVPDLPSTRYRVYPIADHVADKVCALHEMHPRTDGPAQPSTRYRDLVDLATIARTTRVDAGPVRVAIGSEASRRHLTLPDSLTIPSTSDWPAGFARELRNAPAAVDRTLEAALGTARRFIDPILQGMAAGAWDPVSLSWVDGAGERR